MVERDIKYTESGTGSVHRQSSLYSRHSRKHVESVSMEICTILTRLGYGEEVRRWRVDKYKEFDRLLNARTIDVNLITVGSKAEGLTCFYESDSDLLYALKRVLCVEAGINLGTIPDDIDVFRMDTRACPGHCRLLQERKAHREMGCQTPSLAATTHSSERCIIRSQSNPCRMCKK
ncbi:uncharacterized protein LOC127851222 [Dreissena polymorpha]|uniref:uncharacterized protein LOC127851222 n=1 Tax=Dreissena polymorpha TaxID=45954 RepID=UPI0022647C47|nr:uncharacterized protein LOC127851222 [Dreissena polymorpha]